MNIEDFVRIKEGYAFEVDPLFHYGQIVDVGLNKEIKINFDRRYNHDSFIWVDMDKYEVIK